MSASANCGILGLEHSLASEIMQYASMLADIWKIVFGHIQKIDSHPPHRIITCTFYMCILRIRWIHT